MKISKLLIIIFTLLSKFVYGQIEQDTIPFNKCDEIQVMSNMSSDEELYKFVGRKLIENGFAIENANKDFFSIKTTYSISQKKKFNYYFTVNISNKSVRIQGMYVMVPSFNGVIPVSGNQRVTFTTTPFLADYKSIFSKMDEFAKSLNGERILYRKVSN